MYITARGWASFRKDETSRACNNQERACLFLPGRENNWIIEAAWTVTFHLSHIFDLHILSYIVHSNDENFTNVFSVFKRKRSLLNQVVLGLGPNSALNLFLPLHPQQVQVAALWYLPKGSTAQERASLGRKESCTAVALSAPVAYPAMKNAEVTLPFTLQHCAGHFLQSRRQKTCRPIALQSVYGPTLPRNSFFCDSVSPLSSLTGRRHSALGGKDIQHFKYLNTYCSF